MINNWALMWASNKLGFLSFLDPFARLAHIARISPNDSGLFANTVMSSRLYILFSKSLNFLDTSFLSDIVLFKTRATSSILSQTLCSSSDRFYFFIKYLLSRSRSPNLQLSSILFCSIFSYTFLISFMTASVLGGILFTHASTSAVKVWFLASIIFIRSSISGSF